MSTAAVAKAKNKSRGNVRASTRPELRFDRVYTTRNYNIFKTIKGNRVVNENWVIQLAEHIEAKDLRVPVEVTRNLEVIDGQHRIEARKLLEIDVPYIIINADSLADVQTLNNDRKKWNNTDYLESFITRGNQHYVELKSFRQTYGLPLNVSLGLLMNGLETGPLSTNEIFKAGQFEVRYKKVAVDVAEKLASLDGIFPKWKTHAFSITVVQLLRTPSFSWDRFMQKIKARPNMLRQCATREDYVDAVEKLYNFKVPASELTSLRYAK